MLLQGAQERLPTRCSNGTADGVGRVFSDSLTYFSSYRELVRPIA
jgi:hypothetical protein